MTEQILAVQRMQDYIEKNKAEEISLSDLARASLFSPWYAYRLFRNCLGLTPTEYIRFSFLMVQNIVNLERRASTCLTFNQFSYRSSASRNACASSSVAGTQRIISPTVKKSAAMYGVSS